MRRSGCGMPTRPSMSTARPRATFFETSLCTRYASMIWAPTVKYGCIAVSGSWKIIDIFCPRSARTRSGLAPISSGGQRRVPLGDRGLAVGGLVLVDHALAGGLVQLAGRVVQQRLGGLG